MRKVLTIWLRDAMPGRDVRAADTAEAGEVYIGTPMDLSPAAAAELVARGVRPIVLAPMPRAEERARYALAGAAYVAMAFDGKRGLENAIEAASNGCQSFAMAVPAACSQASSP